MRQIYQFQLALIFLFSVYVLAAFAATDTTKATDATTATQTQTIPSIQSSDVPGDSTKMVLTWDHPIARVDGTPFLPEEIQYSTLQYECNGKIGTITIQAPGNSVIVGKPVDGLTCAYSVRTTDIDNLSSSYGQRLVVTGPYKPIIEKVEPMAANWSAETVQYLDDHFALAIQ